MHIPVLVDEVVEYVSVVDPGNVVDGTVGAGGYAKSILAKNPKARVLGIDLDQISLDKLKKELVQSNLTQRIKLVHGNYSDIKKIVRENKFTRVKAVVLDLGFSSLQLDDEKRGFSFQATGPLDMRFDQSQKLTAHVVINQYTQEKLAEIFSTYGEEKFSKLIAKRIAKNRPEEIKTTDELLEVIKQAIPARVKHKANDSARRIFQAVRIEVNKELENLQKALVDIVDVLDKKGRVAVVSFHSLEDRIVKQFFNQQSIQCVCPPDFPQCVCHHNPRLKVITKKPIRANFTETANNPRSRPAKLRVAERV
ncbi:MAG: 16S rRNA (cytosine(1402)-N(4))-methyltransferase RsmH [bacterium]|nr:16S rRNA (cytosine(1402)-N(4))-methyltransferase RsmH [bacterium]